MSFENAEYSFIFAYSPKEDRWVTKKLGDKKVALALIERASVHNMIPFTPNITSVEVLKLIVSTDSIAISHALQDERDQIMLALLSHVYLFTQEPIIHEHTEGWYRLMLDADYAEGITFMDDRVRHISIDSPNTRPA